MNGGQLAARCGRSAAVAKVIDRDRDRFRSTRVVAGGEAQAIECGIDIGQQPLDRHRVGVVSAGGNGHIAGAAKRDLAVRQAIGNGYRDADLAFVGSAFAAADTGGLDVGDDRQTSASI